MITEELYSIVKKMNKNGVIISFNGSFTQEIIEEIGESIKNYIEQDNCEMKGYEVLSIYIEQSQNIKNYFYKKVNIDNDKEFLKLAFESIIVIGKEQDDYYICSENIINNVDVKGLKEKLNYINSLNKEQLKAYYKEKLKFGKNNDLGAGLGLINMARKASKPLKYLFMERDKKYSFFILKVNI